MNAKLNRLYFTSNLREGDLGRLIVSLNGLLQAELIAGKHGIKTESELEDYERIVTLLVPTSGLAALASDLKTLRLRPGTLDVYDPTALSIAKDLGFIVEDMTSENQSTKND